MKNQVFSLLVALGLSAGLATAACAAPPAPKTVAPQQASQQEAMNNTAQRAYDAGVSPGYTVPVTGVYDQGDRYLNAQGFPLPGDTQMFLHATGN